MGDQLAVCLAEYVLTLVLNLFLIGREEVYRRIVGFNFAPDVPKF